MLERRWRLHAEFVTTNNPICDRVDVCSCIVTGPKPTLLVNQAVFDMCGIAGIYAYRSTARAADRDELVRMRDYMASRGPDGSGEWYSDDGRVGFGHRRLSIIDLSSRGAQPMQTADGRLVVTFNGEIYNYRALRSGLEAKGYAFRSNSDTEVLLHLYAELGHEMLRELRGMFAFAYMGLPRAAAAVGA